MAAKQENGMSLQDWANGFQPPESLIYNGGYWDQIIFVRDKIPDILAETFEEYEAIRVNIKVISEHISKSIRLPVFRVELAYGTTFTMRYNFYDWKVSVSSPRDVKADFMSLFDSSKKIHEVYCEGFPKELVYGSYANNKRQFTIELHDKYQLFTFFWIFAHQVLGKRKEQGLGA